MWWKILVIVMACNGVQAQEPTTVEAVANTPDGGKNIAIIEQPNSENPLGNPIVGPYVAPKAYNAADALHDNINAVAGQTNTKGGLLQHAQALGQQFKNTLMEANGEIYDVQSYPVQDVGVIGNNADPQTIYSPNVNQ